MASGKACKKCKTIIEKGSVCSNCESKEFSDTYKGRVNILNPEKSEIAEKLGIKKKGSFAVKLR